MKKWIVIFSLLLIFCIVGISYAAVEVNSERDKVNFTENVIYGDRSAVENLTVKCDVNYDEHLFWESTYVTGENPQTSTEYRFSAMGEPVTTARSYTGLEMEAVWEYGLPRSEAEAEGIGKAYWELFNSIEPGEQGEKIIFYKNYCEYYPLSVSINLPGQDGNYGGWVVDGETKDDEVQSYYAEDIFEEIFKIPVLENEAVNVSIEKRQNGGMSSWGSGFLEDGQYDSFGFNTVSAYDDSNIYFTFDAHTSKGEIIDTSEIEEGYGIYALPYYMDEDSTIHVVPKDLKNVYLLDTKVSVLDLQINLEKTRLHLFTVEDNLCIITIIDIETMKAQQKIELGIESEVMKVFLYDDFMTLWLTGDRIALVSMADTEEYELCFIVPRAEADIENFRVINEDFVMDWNGETLAICSGTSALLDAHRGGGFYLAAYDKTGLIYYGEYASSLAAGFLNSSRRYCSLTGLEISYNNVTR